MSPAAPFYRAAELSELGFVGVIAEIANLVRQRIASEEEAAESPLDTHAELSTALWPLGAIVAKFGVMGPSTATTATTAPTTASTPATAGADSRPLVLVAVDFSRPSQHATTWALNYAQAVGARVHLIHVVEPQWRIADFRAGNDDIRAELDTVFSAAETQLATIASSAREQLGTVEERLTLGRPAAEIVQMATELGADLVVMGTHGHSGLARLFIGSVAESVVRKAPCTVVTVKTPQR